MVLSIAVTEPEINNSILQPNLPLHAPKRNTFFYELDLRQNRILHISTSISDVLGYSSTEIIQKGLKWFVEQIHPDDLKNLNRLADHQPHYIVPLVYYRFKHKHGHFCRLYENRCLLNDLHGFPVFLIGKIEVAG